MCLTSPNSRHVATSDGAGDPATAAALRQLVLLRRIRDTLERDHTQPLDVAALSRAVQMSPGHLTRDFQAAYGQSPYAYLMMRRIEQASRDAALRPSVA